MIAIPYAMLRLHAPGWLPVLVGLPLSYVQVLVVDGAWSVLAAWPPWHRFLERRRSARVERLLARRGSFWATAVAAPVIGPWLVMAFMRYANVPQRRVALPMLFGLGVNAIGIAAVCHFVPRLFAAVVAKAGTP
jgi:hypothetical protein